MLHTSHLCPAGAGYFPDEYNCRKYWHCIKGTDTPKHIMCPDDADGNPEMFDLVFNGCNYDYLTHCDGRPVCDECNDNCEATPTDAPDCTPEDQADMYAMFDDVRKLLRLGNQNYTIFAPISINTNVSSIDGCW